MDEIYKNGWELYKTHTSTFVDDLEYYSSFIENHCALELFAGFGRVTNPLLARGHKIETVEILNSFSDFIELPENKKHVTNVLTFSPKQQFLRIFAAYNSFCLLTQDSDITIFFRQLEQWLAPGGKASLNYYHPDYWSDAVSDTFTIGGSTIKYTPAFDLSKRKTEKIGVWTDHFEISGQRESFNYMTRIYECADDLLPYLEGTGLRLVGSVENFNVENVKEPGWIDFILEKV